MRIRKIRTLDGPNVFHSRPVLKMTLDIGPLEDTDSSYHPEFVDRLIATLPGLHKHRCSKGYEGGFIERLRTGTWMAHIVEHMSLELSDRAGISVGFGKTVMTDERGVYDVAVAYQNESAMRELLRVTVEFADHLFCDQPYPLDERIAAVREIAEDTALGPSTRAIYDAAKRQNVPVRRLNEGALLQLGYGSKRKLVESTVSSNTSHIAVEIAGDKDLTKALLQKASVPVPAGEVVRTREAAVEAALALGFPVVIKPLDGNHGRGVTLHVSSPEDAVLAFDNAQHHSSRVIVEQMLEGRDYRVVVVGGKLVAASERVPAHVIGDGEHTIHELIDQENANPLRGDGHAKALTKLDAEAAVPFVVRRGLTLASIPAAGEQVLLRDTGNISTGGVARDVTDVVHPAVRSICERAARTIGLDICGLDLIMPDIAQPFTARSGIIELNAGPGIRMHHHPQQGTPRNVGKAIVGMLYPNDDNGRIPIVSITGTNGKTTVTRMITHVLAESGCTVGMTTTDGIHIAGEQIASGDTTGPWSARLVLSDTSVQAAVLETARGGIVRSGLGYDWSDISIMTNIQPDHIGQDGIHDLEDILHIKSVVAERVREGGTLILNADDPLLSTLMERSYMQRLPREIVYFSLQGNNPLVLRHLDAGGTAYIRRDGVLLECHGNEWRILANAVDIPLTMHGTASFQVANCLSAIAACRAYGLSAEFVVASLARFRNSSENRGRANLYSVKDGYVLVDYGHNIGAFHAICDMTSSWHGVCVTGVIAVPGDRSDELINEAARVMACGFDKLIIREDDDKRGRKPGEIATLLHTTIQQHYPDLNVQVVLDEEQAYAHAIENMRHGEVIVLFYDDYAHVEEVLQRFQAKSVEYPERLLSEFTAPKLRDAA